MNNRLIRQKLINPEHIQLIMGMDEQAAEREYDYVRKFIGVDHEEFTIKSYCAHHELNYSEIKSFLFPNKSGISRFLNQRCEQSIEAYFELNI